MDTPSKERTSEVEIERERTVMEVVGSGFPRVVFFQIEQSDMALHSQPPVLAHLIVYTGLQTKIERPVDVLIVQLKKPPF